MFFFSLAVFSAVSWCTPWWVSGILGGLFGWLRPAAGFSALSFSAAAGLAWAALAYVEDGRNYGLVSRRLGGLLGLPHPLLLFLIMAVLGFVTVLLSQQAGAALRRLFRGMTVS